MLIGVAERRVIIAGGRDRRPVGGLTLGTTLGSRLLRAILGRLFLTFFHAGSVPAGGGG